jgi:hypothetical protein
LRGSWGCGRRLLGVAERGLETESHQGKPSRVLQNVSPLMVQWLNHYVSV